MEQVILVDGNDAEIGVAEKHEAHRRNLLHRAFSVILRRGEDMLLQRRNPAKYHSGGLWANACCGHPRPGEAVAAAAERRLFEEMGVRCPLRWSSVTHYQCGLDGGMSENEIVHLFLGDYDGPIAPDPAEVAEWKWVNFARFCAEAPASPDVVYWLRDYIRKGLL